MSLNLSDQFHSRWLGTPENKRIEIKNNLTAIIDLLEPETNLDQWQKKHGMETNSNSISLQLQIGEPADAIASTHSSLKNQYNSLYVDKKSPFLQSVTGDQEEEQEPTQSLVEQPEILNVTIPAQSKSAVTETKLGMQKTSQQQEELTVSLKLSSHEKPQTEVNPRVLAKFLIKKLHNSEQNTNSVDDNLAAIEAQLDDYLTSSVTSLKDETMAFIIEELTYPNT